MIIGLTGGIASGKSTAARYLAELGAFVIDADKLGHQVYEPGTPGHRAVVAAFGDDILAEDGTINRRALGGKVFGKPDELKRLTDIAWPEIRRMGEAQIATAKAEDAARPVIVEAAVLFEAGWDSMGDEVWVVIAEPAKAVARAVERDGFDESEVKKRLDAQLSNEERSARANVVIENNTSLEALTRQLDEHYQRISAAR
ncbi:MAG: dephospho-CoA kinase [Gammaproteobacteria bacterium]